MIFETHCHLDYLKAKSFEEIIQDAHNAGVTRIVTISVDPSNIKLAHELSVRFPHVYYSQGIHPHDAKEMTDDLFLLIKERAKDPKMVAVGEIGLDYFYNHSPKEIQLSRFEQQLILATELNKPVIIHSRDADEDMITLLTKYAPQLSKKGVIHSFSSTLELASTALHLGFYLGFNGMVTFKKADNIIKAVELCPIDRMLIETDAPFLTPTPHRGIENAPAYLPFILKKIAEIKKVDPLELEEVLWRNSCRFFNVN
jgi:TatD DNase family protein